MVFDWSSPAVSRQVIIHDAGTSGYLFIGNVGGDETVSVEPDVADWVPENKRHKSPLAPSPPL